MHESSAGPWPARARIHDQVLFQEVGEHSALLHMETEIYFGLDDVGTRMWKALCDAETLGAAAEALAAIYDGAPEQIRNDLLEFVRELERHGLVEIDA